MDPPPLASQWCKDPLTRTLLYPFLFLFPFLSLFVVIFRSTRSRGLNLPPSPPKLPLLGNLHQLGTLPHQSLRNLSQQYGPLMLLHLGKIPTLIVTSADIASEITKNQDIVFANRPKLKAADILFFGCKDLAFCPYGEYWRQARKIVVLELLSQRRVQSFQFVREEVVADMVAKVRDLCPSRAAINLTKMIGITTSNIVSRAALGQKSEGQDNDKTFGEISRKAIELIGAFCFKDLFPSLGWMDVLTGLDASLKETSKVLHSYLDQVIEEHKILLENEDQNDHNKDLVDILLGIQRDGTLDSDLSLNDLKAILMDMFVGGTDTTSATIVWAMAELVKNPSKMKKAQTEVRRIVKDKSKIAETDMSQLEYLKWVIKEVLRLHSPAMILRETLSSTKLGGYDIPPKTRVLFNIWAIQRDPKLWDNPEEFVPERFAENPIDFKGLHSQLLPFGMGRRGCPGLLFAVSEAEYVLASLLHWFDWELPNGENIEDLDMTEGFGLIVHKKTPLYLVPQLYSS